jgi:hypothetical protein
VPYQGLGSFIVKPTANCKQNLAIDFRVDSSGMSVEILATSSGFAVKHCVAFNPSQATIDRNISAENFLGVQVNRATSKQRRPSRFRRSSSTPAPPRRRRGFCASIDQDDDKLVWLRRCVPFSITGRMPSVGLFRFKASTTTISRRLSF